jgi:microcystin degradation protein MlrC
MRIAIGGIVWESLTFSPIIGTKEDYAYFREKDLLEAFEIDRLAEELDFEPVPTLYAGCKMPGGWSSKEAFQEIKSEILDGIQGAGHLDGIALLLHGSNQVHEIGSAEDALVFPIRELVGPNMLIAGRYDQHANITTAQADALNIITIYRTAPHRDSVSRFHDTLRILVDAIRKGITPRSAYIRIPMLIMGEKSTSATEPMKSLIPIAVQASTEPGILNADISVGFAWGDVSISGMGVAVSYAREADYSRAAAIRNEIAGEVWKRRYDFAICGEHAPDIIAGIERALNAPETTIFMTDVGDNITAGAPGDTTGFLGKLLDRKVPDAVVAGITDQENTRACFECGLGARVSLPVGGKLDTINSKPLKITGEIIHLYTPPAHSLNDVRTATLKVEGVTLVLTEQPWAFVTLKQFQDAGINPLAHKIVVTKVGYQHPEIVDIAPRSFMVLTTGYTTLDLKSLPFNNVIRPIFPLDEFEWEPEG